MSILSAGTSEATSAPFLLLPKSPRTFTFTGSGAGTIQLQKVRSDGSVVDVPDGELSAGNACFSAEGDGYFVWHRPATGTACGVE